jgi:hypothetical protein
MADTWSMGVILFALVCGHLPFEDPNTSNLYRKILSGEYKTPKWISGEVKDLIRKILETDPNRRYTISQIREHPWCTMVPQSAIPRDEIVSPEEAEDTRAEVLKRLDEMKMDQQAVLDAVSSRACNSLSAMYYLLTQKEIARSRLTKKSSSHLSRPETGGLGPENRQPLPGMVVAGVHKLEAIEKGGGAHNKQQQPTEGVVQLLPPSKPHHHYNPSEPVVINRGSPSSNPSSAGATKQHNIPKLNLAAGAQAGAGLVVEGQLSSQSARPDMSHPAGTAPLDLMSQTARPDMQQTVTHIGAASPGGGKIVPPAHLRGLTSGAPTPSSPSPRGVDSGVREPPSQPQHEDLNVVANGIMVGLGLPTVDAERPTTRRSKSRAGRGGTAGGGEAVGVGGMEYYDGPGMGKIPSRENVGAGATQQQQTHQSVAPQPHIPKQPQRSGGSSSGRRGRHVTGGGGSAVLAGPPIGNGDLVAKPPGSGGRSSQQSGRMQQHGINGRTIQPVQLKAVEAPLGQQQAMLEVPALSAPSPSKPSPGGKPYAREMAMKNKQQAQQGNIQLAHENQGQPKYL